MDEFMKLAGEWGIELPDEVLDAVAGGADENGILTEYFGWYGSSDCDDRIC